MSLHAETWEILCSFSSVVQTKFAFLEVEMCFGNFENKSSIFCIFFSHQGRGTAEQLPNFVRRAVFMHYDLEGDKTTGFLIRRAVSENVEELTLNGDLYQAGKAVAAHSR